MAHTPTQEPREDGICDDCGEFFDIPSGLDPTPICNLCAQVKAASVPGLVGALDYLLRARSLNTTDLTDIEMVADRKARAALARVAP